ncbi:hypothetical protein AMS68_003904 [Peltaster fructicola]|uniref:Mitochondrial division protein 1 n=1 Tax=Peltaster fructicola TaxID=286661 RepID=A0A6H0XUE3_9PEZI|nr:hypothetical protein AMS68_003904 [Peltaster fructicola]
MDWNECRRNCTTCRADCLEAVIDLNEALQSVRTNATIADLHAGVDQLGELCAAVSEHIKTLPLLATEDKRLLQCFNAQLAASQKSISKIGHALIELRPAKKSLFKSVVSSTGLIKTTTDMMSQSRKHDSSHSELMACLDQIQVINTNLSLSLQLLRFQANYLVPKRTDGTVVTQLTQLHLARDKDRQKLDQALVQCADYYLQQGDMLYAQNLNLIDVDSRQQAQTTVQSGPSTNAAAVGQATNPIRNVATAGDFLTAKPSLISFLGSPTDQSSLDCLAFSFDGMTVAWGVRKDGEAVIELRDSSDGDIKRTLSGGLGSMPISCLAFSSDDTLLASGHEEGAIRIWSLDSGKTPRVTQCTWNGPSSSSGVPARARTLLFTQHDLLVSRHADDELRVWRSDTGKKVHHRRDSVKDVALGPDGKSLAIVNKESLSVIDTVKFKKRHCYISHEVGHTTKHVAWSWKGLLATERGFGTCQLFDTTFKIIGAAGPGRKPSIDATSRMLALAFLPDTRLFAIARNASGMVFVCDIYQNTWHHLHDDDLAGSDIVQLSPTGETLITAQQGGRYCVWNIAKVLQVRPEVAYQEFYAPNAC